MFVKLSRVVMIIGVFIALTGPSNSLHAQRNDTMETIFFNGRFVTMDSAGSKADAVAVKNGKFEAVGVKKGMNKLPGGGSVVLDSEGNPTGALADAQGNVPDQPSPEELKRYYSGGIEKGKFADITVLSEDIFSVPLERIKDVIPFRHLA